MSDTPVPSLPRPSEQQEFSFAVRWAAPVLLFGCTALLLAFIVLALTFPSRYPANLGDALLRLSEIDTAVTELRAEEQGLLKASNELQQRTPTPTVQRIADLQASRADVGAFLRDFASTMGSVHGREVLLTSFVLRHGNEVELFGQVRAGERSLRVLADIVDALRASPSVLHVTEPEYVLAADKDSTSFAPLSLLLTLRTGAHTPR